MADYVTFILVFFKTLVTALVSLSKYVNLDQCVFSVPILCFLELDIDLRTDVFYPLLCRVSCIILLFSIDIYRKPTYTDSIIPIDSCHPIEHKYATIRYLQNRLNSYQLSHEKKEKESKIIQDTLHNNG